MNNKKLKMFIGIILIVALLASSGVYIFKKLDENKNKNEIQEYTPQQEISDDQLRNTLVKLYFKEINSNNLRTECMNVDAKNLIENPYLTLVNLLIQGPTDEILEKTIPDGTRVNDIKLVGDMIILDLSEEFINDIEGAEKESATIYSIVNTLTELNEVNSVKFLIDGNESSGFKDGAIKFDNPFLRK